MAASCGHAGCRGVDACHRLGAALVERSGWGFGMKCECGVYRHDAHWHAWENQTSENEGQNRYKFGQGRPTGAGRLVDRSRLSLGARGLLKVGPSGTRTGCGFLPLCKEDSGAVLICLSE